MRGDDIPHNLQDNMVVGAFAVFLGGMKSVQQNTYFLRQNVRATALAHFEHSIFDFNVLARSVFVFYCAFLLNIRWLGY